MLIFSNRSSRKHQNNFNKMLFIFTLFAISGLTQGFFFGKSVYPDWDKLSVTFPNFSGMPTTEVEAKSDKWVLQKDLCGGSLFKGKRYVLKGDMATMLLFDKDGRIAGIQMAVPKSFPVPTALIGKSIIVEEDKYIITAYFTDPNTICSGTRATEKDYVGDKLFFVDGPDSLMEIPLKESGIGATKWIKGRCFYGMGQHYWLDVSKNMDCNNFFPFFLLYNGGNLNGFGFATFGNLEGTSRVEHPPQSLIRLFFKEKPICIEKYAHLTTQHVYLQRRPYFNFC